MVKERTPCIVVGVSGGKDSSLSAWILNKLGFDITLLYFKTPWHNKPPFWLAEMLGVPLEIIDVSEEFQKFVVEPFARYYLAGMTPNPCSLCNRFVKFGMLLKKAKEKFNSRNIVLATGHYVKLSEENREVLLEEYGRDSQSYFLSLVKIENLRRSLFPLSREDFLKELNMPYPLDQQATRKIAEELGLHKAPPSGDICFVKSNYRGFLKRYFLEKLKENSSFAFKGILLRKENGEVLSFSKNFWEITLGQKFAGEYIISKEFNRDGQILIRTSKNISRSVRIETGKLNVISPSRFNSEIKKRRLPVRLRYRQPLLYGNVKLTDSREAKRLSVTVKTSNFYPAPGQVLALYDEEGKHIIAGAVIQKVEDLG